MYYFYDVLQWVFDVDFGFVLHVIIIIIIMIYIL